MIKSVYAFVFLSLLLLVMLRAAARWQCAPRLPGAVILGPDHTAAAYLVDVHNTPSLIMQYYIYSSILHYQGFAVRDVTVSRIEGNEGLYIEVNSPQGLFVEVYQYSWREVTLWPSLFQTKCRPSERH